MNQIICKKCGKPKYRRSDGGTKCANCHRIYMRHYKLYGPKRLAKHPPRAEANFPADVDDAPELATDAQPGAQEKIAVLMARVAQERPLWNVHDRNCL